MQSEYSIAIIQITYQLILQLTKETIRFPKFHKHILGKNIYEQALTLIETLIHANSLDQGIQRINVLHQASRHLFSLRLQLRLAKDLQCLPVNSFQQYSNDLDQIAHQLKAWKIFTKNKNRQK